MVLAILLGAGVILLVAYKIYGGYIAKVFGIDDKNPVPSERMYDGVDYVPSHPMVVLGHHFSSIAGAGPIVGPIIAALAFGWVPALLWILIGSIFVGGLHDFGSMIASVRYKARSIPELCRMYISSRAYRLFLIFIWLALVYVIIVFLDLTAKTFATDPGVTLSSTLIIFIAAAFGLALYRLNASLSVLTIVGVIGLLFSVWAGNSSVVISAVAGIFPGEQLSGVFGSGQNFWRFGLLVYCVVAAILPVWLLLQPRDFLSSFLLYASLLGGIIGIVIGTGKISLDYPAFLGFHSEMNAAPGMLFPVLFITIACGACSGFHCVVASGTTSKQLAKESDTLRVGYGAMLIEGFLAVLSLLAAVSLGKAALTSSGQMRSPLVVYGDGMAGFFSFIGLSEATGKHLALLALSTFLLTTLDTCTRLARFVFEEFFNLDRTKRRTRWVSTLCAVILSGTLVYTPFKNKAGELIPAWKAIWPVFGATNQLLAGLALLAVAIWLKRTSRNHWIATIPMAFMIVMTLTALQGIVRFHGFSLIGMIAAVLFLLALVLVYEALAAFRKGQVNEEEMLKTEGTLSLTEVSHGRVC